LRTKYGCVYRVCILSVFSGGSCCVCCDVFRRAGSSVVELSIAARRVTGSNPVSRLLLLQDTPQSAPFSSPNFRMRLMHLLFSPRTYNTEQFSYILYTTPALRHVSIAYARPYRFGRFGRSGRWIGPVVEPLLRFLCCWSLKRERFDCPPLQHLMGSPINSPRRCNATHKHATAVEVWYILASETK
jgi:hypothetical protein